MAAALDALRAIDAHPAIKEATLSFNRGKRLARPYVPYITRTLLISAFVEDAFRTLVERKSQLEFFSRELYIPAIPAFLLILISTLSTFAGAALIFYKPLERRAAQILLAVTVYQQVIYGRHSPITSGNFGFLIRNLCLIGTLLLLITKGRPSQTLPTLPGIPDPPRVEESRRDNIVLATRIMLGMLCIEMFDVISWYWAVLILPMSVAIVVGYKTDLMALLLTIFYIIATLLSKQFWFIDTSVHEYAAFHRDVIRFEFLQTISIMSGFVILIMSGPGALSLDEQLRRRKAW